MYVNRWKCYWKKKRKKKEIERMKKFCIKGVYKICNFYVKSKIYEFILLKKYKFIVF